MSALSKAMGHTNVKSTSNAYSRYKKRWGFGNISTKVTSGAAAGTDDAADGCVFFFFSFLRFIALLGSY